MSPGKRILVEGGPRLLGDFYAEHLVDEQFLTLAPQIAGRDAGDRRLSLVMGKVFAPRDALWGTLVDLRRGSSHLFLRYSFPARRPAAGRNRWRRRALRLAALAGPGQCNGDGLLDRLFFVRGWLVPIDPFLLPVIHQCLDIAADDRLAGYLSLAARYPSRLRNQPGRACHQSWRCNRIEIRPVSVAPFAVRLFDIRRAFRAHVAITRSSFAGFAMRTDNMTPLGRRSLAMRLVVMIPHPGHRTDERPRVRANRRRGQRHHRPPQCADRARGEPCGDGRARGRFARTFGFGILILVPAQGQGIVLTGRIVVKNADVGGVDIRHQCRNGIRITLGVKSRCNDSLHGNTPSRRGPASDCEIAAPYRGGTTTMVSPVLPL